MNAYDIIGWAEGFHDEIGGASESEAETLKLWEGMKQWTTEPPRVEGVFWAMRLGEPLIVEVFFSYKDKLMADLTDEELPRELSEFTHWLGPLPVPELPTKGD